MKPRTLGLRPVASFLKISLDIAYVFSLGWLAMLAAFALISAFGMISGVDLPDWPSPNSRRLPMFVTTARGAAWLMSFCFTALATVIIVGRLRKIVATLVVGTPFLLENARRLRVIGLALALTEASEYLVWIFLVWASPNLPNIPFRPEIDYMGLFAIVVMFVFAEVFEEGVRLRQDVDLTI